jgi:hypothetical protein
MNTTTPPPHQPRPNGVSLYLRVDGTLLLVRDAQAVEIALTPRQLLELGMDALQLAVTHEPMLIAEVAEVLSGTTVIVPMEAAPCATHLN